MEPHPRWVNPSQATYRHRRSCPDKELSAAGRAGEVPDRPHQLARSDSPDDHRPIR